jgi:hypothetical protein
LVADGGAVLLDAAELLSWNDSSVPGSKSARPDTLK